MQPREWPHTQEVREDAHGHHEAGEEPERRVHAAEDAPSEQTSQPHVAEGAQDEGENEQPGPDAGEDSRELESTDGEEAAPPQPRHGYGSTSGNQEHHLLFDHGSAEEGEVPEAVEHDEG